LSILRRLFIYIRLNFRQMLPVQPCVLCGAASHYEHWCAECDAALPYLSTAHCPVCALPTWQGEVCGNCLKNPPHYTRTVAVYAYAFPLDKLIKAVKYGGKLYLAESLGDRLAQCVVVKPDCLIALPLHPARLRERGFNQSLQLARRIGRQLSLPVLESACIRVRDTPSQSTLPWQQRGKNMRKAFSCTTDVVGKHIAVVDDVMTSGATLNELALTLMQAGAREVSVWVVARTLPHTGKPLSHA
jgi:ComF family protein